MIVFAVSTLSVVIVLRSWDIHCALLTAVVRVAASLEYVCTQVLAVPRSKLPFCSLAPLDVSFVGFDGVVCSVLPTVYNAHHTGPHRTAHTF